MQSPKMATRNMVPLIFGMALPAMISMLINALYNIVDSIFVARYSQDALTAVSLVFPLQQLVIAVAVGTAIGVNSLMSRRLGAQQKAEAEIAADNGLILALISGAAFVFIGLFLSRPFLSAMTENSSILEQAVTYSYVAVGLSAFLMYSIMCEKIQQATGNMVLPMFQGLVGAIINIVLDPIMIFGLFGFPEMGILGAAIATVIGQIVGMLIGIWAVFFHQKAVKVRLRGAKLRKQTVLEIYRVGLPGIIMQSVVSVMIAGLNVILIGFSEAAVSVLGVYFKLQTFVFMPVFGLNQGALPVMGFSYGARNKKRLMSAYRVSLIGGIIIMVAGLVAFQMFPVQMLRLFAKDEGADLLVIGVPALRTISWSFLGACFGIINSTLFQAIGKGIASLVVSVCRQLVLILPTAWLLGHFYGLEALWFAFPIAEIGAFLISYLLLFSIYRKEIRDMVPITGGAD